MIPGSSSGAGTTVGFGVLPSNLSSSTLTQVSTTGTEVNLGEIFTYALGGGGGVSLTPYSQLFAAQGADGNLHLYKSQLANAGAPATPVQFSSFSVPGTDTICPYPNQGYSKITDPTSAFIGVTVYTAAQFTADPNACSDGNPAGVTYLVHFLDSASTAPITVAGIQPPGTIGTIAETFNASGAITGLVAFDRANNLNFYPAVAGLPSFASPQTLVANVTDNRSYTTVLFQRSGSVLPGGSESFITLTSTAAGQNQVWRVSSTGTAANVLSTADTVTDSGVYDNNNYYFSTSAAGVTPSYGYYAVPLTSGNATLLATTPNEYAIVDSDGSRLILNGFVFGTTSFSYDLSTLSISNPAGITPLVSTTTGSIVASLDYATDQLFVDVVTSSGISGEVITPTGVVKSALTAGTYYLTVGGSGAALGYRNGGSILSVQGITPGTSNEGGGTLYNVATSTLARTPVTQNGSPYVVPAGTSVYGFSLGSTIAQGLGYSAATGYFGWLVDTTKNQIVTTAPGTTELTPFY